MKSSFGKVCMFLLAGMAVGLGLSHQVWGEFLSERRASADVRSDLRRVEDERAELLSQAARYDNRQGQEELARGKGFRYQGERSLDELLPR